MKKTTYILILLISIPIFIVLYNLFTSYNENWIHISNYLLKDYIINSLKLAIGTALFSSLLGVLSAWFVSYYDFPHRKFFEWALILPLTIPPFIGAYVYAGMLSYTGTIQVFLMRYTSFSGKSYLIDIMSIPGAIFIFSMFLFPYIYLTVKSFFSKQISGIIEASYSLGKNTLTTFFKVILPLARPAIVGGGSLVIMEVFNDYGVVKYYGIPTFSTGIFKAWFSLGDINTAIKLSSILLIFVFGILFTERLLRKHKAYFTKNKNVIKRRKIKGFKLFLILFFLITLFLLSFLLPLLQLIQWTIFSFKNTNIRFFELTFNSIFISLISSILIIVIALILSDTIRFSGKSSKYVAKLATMGYSIPGAVIAVGVMVFFIGLDKKIIPLYNFLNFKTNLVLSSSILMLIYAYIVRFLNIAYSPIDANFEKNGKIYHESSRSLGKSFFTTFIKIDIPMIKPAIISAFIFSFIEIIKELPLTLILRPFNFDTLATKVFEYANDEMIHEASVASITIIFIIFIFIIILRKITGDEK
ncbi:iron(III) transport system permease protein [Marinitoga hydrogenitolerans DSM 16785]|uniref:Iron(III) transport system permease protein n=1 Tax=Marinitoga hydrogenitolerans (strain DSM 16785 / JCM 12826 / AT1271) TaxID=1122195 RepID=A0A1M4V9R3_MARH1|nr:iron ABC transporter permease [Marinitoga hydrogenitolerans]SHE65613.1 iron(III) transport system permease protein [Marinitoga hydrogenitolerans DSM 16785]